jgi:hypothetical protein
MEQDCPCTPEENPAVALRRDDHIKLVTENQELRRTIEGLERLVDSFKQDMLRERLWRIQFQLDYLAGLRQRTREELGGLEGDNGSPSESPVHGQG